MLVDDLRRPDPPARVDQRRQVFRVVQRVAAPEPRLLRQVGEGHEALGPARVTQAAAPDAHRDAIHREAAPACPDLGSLLYRLAITQARCLR